MTGADVSAPSAPMLGIDRCVLGTAVMSVTGVNVVRQILKRHGNAWTRERDEEQGED